MDFEDQLDKRILQLDYTERKNQIKFFNVGMVICGAEDDTEENLMTKFEKWLGAIPNDTNKILFGSGDRMFVQLFVNEKEE